MAQEPTPQELVAELTALLKVETDGEDAYLGARTPEGASTGAGRVFGGQVIAQALAAAEATVTGDRPPHSLHAYFLRMGDDTQPIRYDVAHDLDGGSFSNRRVAASQGGKPILSLSASFHRREDGVHHQDAMPDVPGPEGLASDLEVRRASLHLFPEGRRAALGAPRPIEQRPVEKLHWMDATPAPPTTHSWFRTVAPVGDDPRLHRAMLAYASDLTLLRTAVLPHGLSWFRDKILEASLDHSLWFHDSFRIDEWLLYQTHSSWAGRGRGFITGKIFRQDGALVASVSQEGMIRIVTEG